MEYVRGKVYHCKFQNKYYLFEYREGTSNICHICLSENHYKYSNAGWNFYNQSTEIREANSKETQQMLQSIRKSKFIPIEEIKDNSINNYSIF